MDAQSYINQAVQSGKDVVFGEEHQSISHTFSLMEKTIQDNPNGVGAIVLELSPSIQDLIEQAGTGEVSQENFILQARINTEQEYLELAGGLLNEGRINQEQYDWYETFINDRIDSILNRDGGAYSDADFTQDQVVFGTVYFLAQTCHENNTPLIANNFGRERSVLADLNDLTLDDWVQYISDRADFENLLQTINLETTGPILVHRGANHIQNVGGENNRDGMDDLLEERGRDVLTVGVYIDADTLASSKQNTLDNGMEIADPSDVLIIGENLIMQNELTFDQDNALPHSQPHTAIMQP